MTDITLDQPSDRYLDLNRAADVIAPMLDTGDHITAGPLESRASWVSLFVCDAWHLTQLLPAHGREEHQEIADRLWMVCASPEEIVGFAKAVEASRREKLITDHDAINLARYIGRGCGR